MRYGLMWRGVVIFNETQVPRRISSATSVSNSRSTWYLMYRCASSFHRRLKAIVLVVPFASSGTYRVGNEGKGGILCKPSSSLQ